MIAHEYTAKRQAEKYESTIAPRGPFLYSGSMETKTNPKGNAMNTYAAEDLSLQVTTVADYQHTFERTTGEWHPALTQTDRGVIVETVQQLQAAARERAARIRAARLHQ
jgi:hypothetical protein